MKVMLSIEAHKFNPTVFAEIRQKRTERKNRNKLAKQQLQKKN